MVKKGQCLVCGASILLTYALSHLCCTCLDERAWLRKKLREAEKQGVCADLTLAQWKETLEYFHGKCAYCQKGPFDVFEHFIPMCLEGGTTWSNVVPSCNSCNRRKYNLHPDQVTSIPQSDIERVRNFLNAQKFVKKGF